MTLLELLVQELPKRGGWPEAANKLKFSTTRRIVDDVDNEYFHFPYLDRLVLRERVKFVTREQYESAIAAKKPSWNGVGLPPVGCECEFTLGPHEPDEFDGSCGETPKEGSIVNVVAHKTTSHGNKVAVVYWDDAGAGRAMCLIGPCLKPTRSEADKKRDAAIKALDNWLPEYTTDIPSLDGAIAMYDAIASGKIPGVKLED